MSTRRGTLPLLNVAIVVLIALAGCAPGESPSSAATDEMVFRDETRKISFTYSSRIWHPGAPIQPHTLILIEWRLLGGEFVASCYLQAIRNEDAAKIETRVHEAMNIITDQLVAIQKKRNSTFELLSSEAVEFGSKEAVLFRWHSSIVQANGGELGATTDMFYTVLAGEQVIFQCSYIDRRIDSEPLKSFTQEQIRLIMDSFSFGQ